MVSNHVATVYGAEDHRSAAERFGRANMEALGLFWDFATLRELISVLVALPGNSTLQNKTRTIAEYVLHKGSREYPGSAQAY